MFFKNPVLSSGPKQTDSPPEGSAAFLPLLLNTLATLAIELASRESESPLWRALLVTLALMGAVGVGRFCLVQWAASRSARGTTEPKRACGRFQLLWQKQASTLFLLALLVLPLILAHFAVSSPAPEILLLLCLRSFGLGLAVLSVLERAGSERLRRLNGLVSLCLVTFAVVVVRDKAVLGIAAGYMALGCVWLALSHWNSQRWGKAPNLLPNRDSGSGTVASAPPWAAVAVAVLIVTGAFTVALAGANRETTALLGWIPGSGGTGRWSGTSRGGVHDDGDAEVGATKNAWSVGFVDTDVFIESREVSLYDTYSDTIGKPRPPKEAQRKVVVPNQNFIERHTEPAENHAADEQFSTRRTPPREQGSAHSRPADALLYVKGRVPLHLRMTAYDRFDGEQWHRDRASTPGHDLAREDEDAPRAASGKPAANEGMHFRSASTWLRFGTQELGPYFGGREEHHIKIGTLRTNRVLAPGQLERFRIGRIDQPKFFQWAHDGILHLTAPRFPPATTFVTETRMSDTSRLAYYNFESPQDISRIRADARYFSMPGRIAPITQQLAHEWTKGIPRGWAQVEAIVAGLRHHCRHDGRAVAPDQCDDPVEHFLSSRRGPDYLFATSAVLMLRSLGYPARMVSGFYARPERFVARTGHTLVQKEDAHFWPEVLLPRTVAHPYDRTWIAIEPTPGFELLPPLHTFWERLAAISALTAKWVWSHAGVLLALSGVLAVLWRVRFRILDLGATLIWHVRWGSRLRCSQSGRITATLQLLDARGTWGKCPRLPGQTPARWLTPLLAQPEAPVTQDLKVLLALADYVVFAPPNAPMPYDDEVRALCLRIVKGLGLSALSRELSVAHPRNSSPYSVGETGDDKPRLNPMSRFAMNGLSTSLRRSASKLSPVNLQP